MLNGCWKGDKEDWGGVMELEVEGNGCFVSFGVWMGRVGNWVVCKEGVLENGEESSWRRGKWRMGVMRE